MTIHERLARHFSKTPDTAGALFIAANATVQGDVVLGPQTSVFYGAVLRGDIHEIRVGEGTNIQDNAIVHLADDYGAYIGKWCTIGHAAIIHACTIGDECLIGMGATVLDGAKIGARSIVGANCPRAAAFRVSARLDGLRLAREGHPTVAAGRDGRLASLGGEIRRDRQGACRGARIFREVAKRSDFDRTGPELSVLRDLFVIKNRLGSPFEGEERVAVVGVGAVAPIEFAPGQMPPLGEKRVPGTSA